MKAKIEITILAALAWLTGAALDSPAATVVVTNLADSGPGTLRQAIIFANTNAGADTITFDAALSGKTNVLTSGQLTISNSLAIDASALPAGFKISGNGNSRVFEVAASAVVTLNSLTIQDGFIASDEGGGIYVNYVTSGASLTLTNCTLSGNSASVGGGGISFHGVTLTATGCEFSGNSTGEGGGIFATSGTLTINGSKFLKNSAGYGGGIEIVGGSTLSVTGCQLLGNSASVDGGGIRVSGVALTINNSTVSTNSAGGRGGGIYLANGSTLTINSSTVSSNYAGLDGGGLLGIGSTELNNSTFAGNSAHGNGGGSFNPVSSLTINASTLSSNSAGGVGGGIYYHVLFLTNTIVTGNSAPTNANLYFSGPGAFSGANNLTNGNPLLAPLDNYGGLTATMRPRPGSPAIDAGSDSVTNFLATDQRGYPRRYGAQVDIGAVEARLTLVTNLNDSGPGSLRAALADPPELIGFAANLSGGALTLTSGQIPIAANVTVDASTLADVLAISGNYSSRIFEVNSGATVTLDSLLLYYGNAGPGSGGAILVDGGGTLTVNDGDIGLSSALSGGGINNGGTLTLRDSSVSLNHATANAGAIENNGGTLTITGCNLGYNSANYAGGIASYFASGVVNIIQSSVYYNEATNNAGAIANTYGSTLTLKNSTLSGNTAGGGGGGIEVYQATVTANNSTISSNSASYGGGINNYGVLLFTNTIVAGNNAAASPNIYTDVSGSLAGANNLTNGNPLLAPFDYYGGSTQTMPPLHGSPAIDAGSDSVTNFLATDQRGYPRPSGAHVDIGAVEAQAVSAANAPVLKGATIQGGAFSFSFINVPVADFTVLTSTNVTLPLGQWSILGAPVQNPPGQYTFTDSGATNYPRRFYRLVSP